MTAVRTPTGYESRSENVGEAEGSLEAAMNRHADGDDSGFAVVYDLLAPRLFAFARRRLDAVAAEDIVQQTFLNMHCARASYLRGSKVVPWAFAIARRLMIDGFRRPTARVELHVEADMAGNDCPHEELGAKELGKVLRRAMERLPAEQREALELVQADALSIAEAAETLGISENAVKLRVHRARKALKEALEEAT